MAVRAIFDADGFNPAFWLPGVNCDEAPPGAVEISDEDWGRLLLGPGQWRWTGKAVEPYAPPQPQVDLKAYAAAAHVARRDGGVMIGQSLVKTDSESRSLITGAYSLSEARPDATIDFKAASGWVSLSAAEMQSIAIGVGMWVQACYSAYRSISGKIEAGTITTTSQIDAAFAAVAMPG